MSNLFTSLSSSGDALGVYERALEVTQNNVNNASTPGYARQSLTLSALPFAPLDGLPGGVEAGAVQSARNQFADRDLREKLQTLGYFDRKVTSLSALESSFDISGNSGIDAALNHLYQSFSAWSANANDPSSRQSVLAAAAGLAQSFQAALADLRQSSAATDQQIRDNVDQINRLTSQLSEFNQQRQRMQSPDAGLDAKIHATLEDLSQYVNFDALEQPDGTVTVLLDGQTPLVIGDRQFQLHADLNTGHIFSAEGREVTSQISGGELSALLEVRNRILPSLAGDADQPGDINRLAKAVVDRVNQLLTSGHVSDGPPPVSGKALFTYDPGDPASIARTLSVNPDIHAEDLAAIDPGPPYVGNGTALKLAGLAQPSASEDKIDGLSYIEFYGATAGRVGGELASAKNNLDTQKQVAAQARSLRDQISGVSLDAEAVRLIEFQRAYQATARMVSVLNDLTQVTVDLVR